MRAKLQVNYYAFGLKIAALSSRRADVGNEGSLKNNYLYNDKELCDEGDLNWYDYGFRNYDPQIARFMQVDPLAGNYPNWSPYVYAGNDPISFIDVMGLGPGDVLGYIDGAVVTQASFLEEVVVSSTKRIATETVSKNILAGIGNSLLTGTASKAGDIANHFNIQNSLRQAQLYSEPIMNRQTHRNGMEVKQEPNRKGSGLALTSSDGQGGSPHISPEHRDIGNQQTENIDLLMMAASFSERLGTIERPNPKNFWEWDKMFSSTLPLAGGNVPNKSRSNVSNKKVDQTKLDPAYQKKGNVIYDRQTGLHFEQDGKGRGTLTNKKPTDTFPPHKMYGFPHPK